MEILCYLHLEKPLISRHLDFVIYFLRGKNITISETRSHGEGFVCCWI